MSDHKDYFKKNSSNDSQRTSREIVETEDNCTGEEKENASDFDKNLIALIEFQPWIYDKNKQKD